MAQIDAFGVCKRGNEQRSCVPLELFIVPVDASILASVSGRKQVAAASGVGGRKVRSRVMLPF